MPAPSILPVRRIYTGDNLPILQSMDSETVDLIYLDPPFNSKKWYENPIQAGDKKAAASFKDTWALSDIHIDYEWTMERDCSEGLDLINAMATVNGDSWRAYLIYMGVRLLEMRRILRKSGGIYYHCDPVMSHGVKLLMDAVFGGGAFRNEIIWHYAGTGQPKNKFPRKHDVILFYARDDNNFNPVRVPAKKTSGWTGKNDKLCDSVWDINTVFNSPERKNKTDYPTQKPMPLLDRIVSASSHPGELVLDPFCGCATTCLVAEWLKRSWIGIDLSEAAANLIVGRLQSEKEKMLDSAAGEVRHLRALPKRTDLARTDDRVLRPRVYQMQGGKCEGCGEFFPLRNLENDHVVDRNNGGQDEDVNIQLLCGTCNRIKGDRGMEYLGKYLDREKIKLETEKCRQNRRDAAAIRWTKF